MLKTLRTLSRYARWANDRLLLACAGMPTDAYFADRGSFFPSLHKTLNHLLVADRVWLERLDGAAPSGLRLDQELEPDLGALDLSRRALDDEIVERLERADAAEIERVVRYRPITIPEETALPVGLVWSHLFNHQTHHRGQCHTMLAQAGEAPPPLDLVYFLREQGASG